MSGYDLELYNKLVESSQRLHDLNLRLRETHDLCVVAVDTEGNPLVVKDKEDFQQHLLGGGKTSLIWLKKE